jgi:thiol-disulfide isomerase/thioredoxin
MQFVPGSVLLLGTSGFRLMPCDQEAIVYKLIIVPLMVVLVQTNVILAADDKLDLKKSGVFGFPQDKSTVLCDNKDARVSVWNDKAHLYVQAIVWQDSEDSLGETPDGRKIGDSSSLLLDVDGDGKITPNADRSYTLNPWPTLPGLRYSIQLSERGSTPLKGDSKGRGSIHYAETTAGKVRVDSFVIPLAEIGRKPGDKLRFAFYASSPKPKLILNSIGFEKSGQYYSHHLPREKYHEVTLVDRLVSLDATKVPDGRDDQVALDKNPVKPMPKVGSIPPEVSANDWLNTENTPTLAGLKGKVVVVEFWATWCGPCVAGIPHLNKIHEEYGPKGLVLLSFTDQSKTGIENFMKDKPMKYVLGTGSELASEYGVRGIPHAFIIGRDGKVAWHGNPNDKDFDKLLFAELGK